MKRSVTYGCECGCGTPVKVTTETGLYSEDPTEEVTGIRILHRKDEDGRR